MEPSLKEIKKEWHGSIRSYAIGGILSLLLTFSSFALALFHPLTRSWLLLILIFLAFVQATIQLRFFLHVGQEAKPRWESLIFGFMLLLVLVIVLGSLWIMFDLNARVMKDMG